MLPFDNTAFRSWSLVFAGALGFGILFEMPIILFDFIVSGRVELTPASLLLGLGAFGGYFCLGAAIKTFGEVSD